METYIRIIKFFKANKIDEMDLWHCLDVVCKCAIKDDRITPDEFELILNETRGDRA